MGGTGATLVLVFMFCFLAKSQEMRAVGKAAIVPVCFAVNEPLLFAAPIVLNPVFFVPFVFAPIANIWILKIFIDFLGMNGFMYTLPWTVPGPIGTIMGLGFQPLAFVMLALSWSSTSFCTIRSSVPMTPRSALRRPRFPRRSSPPRTPRRPPRLNDAFQGKADAKSVAGRRYRRGREGRLPRRFCSTRCRGNDRQRPQRQARARALPGGGTSGLLANALAKAAKERASILKPLPRHMATMSTCSPTLTWSSLAPQAASYLADLQKDCERVGNKCVACRGKQYIELSQNGDKSLAFVSEQLSK